jgi:hypothetical protein
MLPMKKLAVVAFLSLGALAALAQTARTPATQGAELYIIAPTDNATVTGPVTVRFGLPAGIQLPDTGHHHLLVDADLPPLDKPIPADANHVHFGKGQTETTLTLAPGKHTLQLILGDHLHIPHQPAVVSQKITITVK